MTVSQADFDALKGRLDTLERENAELKKVIGYDFLTTKPPEGLTEEQLEAWWFAKFIPANELESGEYPPGLAQKLTNYQVRDRVHVNSFNALVGRIIKLEKAAPTGSVSTTPQPPTTTQPPATTTPPISTAPTIPPLTATQQAALATALQRGVVAGRLTQTFIDKIIADVRVGKYAIVDANVIGLISGWYYDTASGVTQVDQSAMAPYLAIIDQRDPVTDKLLLPTDPRVKRVSTSGTATPSPAPTSGTYQMGILPGLGYGIVFRHLDPPTGVDFTSVMFAGGEKGWRFLYNHVPYWDPSKPSHSDPFLMQLGIECEQDGVISIRYEKPLKKRLANGTVVDIPPGPYDKPGNGKAIAIKPGGVGTDGQKGKYALIYTGEPGRGLKIGSVPAGGTPNVATNWPITVEP